MEILYSVVVAIMVMKMKMSEAFLRALIEGYGFIRSGQM